jgi:hypothetical protein
MCACVLTRAPVAQNAFCRRFFPLPMALPGFFAVSDEEFVSCIPASACPGMVEVQVRYARANVPLASAAASLRMALLLLLDQRRFCAAPAPPLRRLRAGGRQCGRHGGLAAGGFLRRRQPRRQRQRRRKRHRACARVERGAPRACDRAPARVLVLSYCCASVRMRVCANARLQA